MTIMEAHRDLDLLDMTYQFCGSRSFASQTLSTEIVLFPFLKCYCIHNLWHSQGNLEEVLICLKEVKGSDTGEKIRESQLLVVFVVG
jgi:hypothetical protein